MNTFGERTIGWMWRVVKGLRHASGGTRTTVGPSLRIAGTDR
ncbi:hypothetical protein [Xanthomonas sacchari]|nr:hypothetical protein [Xanthomonas sacchari]